MAADTVTPIDIRSEISNATLIWLLGFGAPGVGLSILKSIESGWLLLMEVQIVLLVIHALVVIFRHRIPFQVRAGGVVVLTFGSGIVVFISFGIPYGYVFFVSAGIMAAVLFGEKVGTAVIAAELLMTGLIYFSSKNGFLPEADPLEITWITWIVSSFTIIMASFGPIISAERARRFLNAARHRAEEATKAKARFLADMSHEVRTPMNGVVGMVDLLMKTKLDVEQRIMLQTVRESGHALLTVINEILDFSKIEADRLKIEAVETVVGRLVEDVGFSLSPAAVQKGLRLITFVDPRLPLMVKTDPLRLRQILTNLAGNAVKFSSDGEVVISAELVSEDETGVLARFSVTDQGPGIDETMQSRLFDEFSQADSSTARRFGGTGLGLAICRRLISLMNGEIEVKSTLGKGSSFVCTIPLSRGEEPPAPPVKADLSGLAVTFVSDSPTLAKAARAYLEYWNATVAVVARPEEIYSPDAMGKKPDVIVLTALPDYDRLIAMGIAVRSRIVLGRSPGQATPALVDPKNMTIMDINPMRRAGLVTAVAIAAGRESPELAYIEEPEEIEDIAPISREEAVEQGCLILVAEDHPANREVIRRQLARLGFVCDIAENGDEALALWRAHSYLIVLTDCHMPVLDGFGLTSAIRAEGTIRGTHQPIIAISANALQGEAERCLAAGMDDFLSKPVELKILHAAIRKWLPHDTAMPKVAAPQQPAAIAQIPGIDEEVFDLSRLITVFGQIDDDMRNMIGLFKDSVEPLITELHEKIADNEFSSVREIAHKTKGAALDAGAKELASIMDRIERAVIDSCLDDARQTQREVEAAWIRLLAAIAAV